MADDARMPDSAGRTDKIQRFGRASPHVAGGGPVQPCHRA